MTLARSWTRQLFGASGAALLVPGAIAGALVVLAFAGGFGRLSSLGQAFSGPSVPGVTPVDATLGGGKSALGRALAAAAAPTGTAGAFSVSAGSTGTGVRGGTGSGTAGSGTGGSGSRGGGGSDGPGSGGSGPGGSGGSGSGGSGSSSRGSGGGGGAGGTGSGAGAGSPPPTPAPPTVVDGVVGIGASITAEIPGPVGTVATQTLRSLGTTVDRVLPLGGSGLTGAASTRGLQLR